MSKEVNRFLAFLDGGLIKDCVLASDYDALLAERDALKKEVEAVLQEMRERKINGGKNTSPTLHGWADRIDAALKGEQP